MIERPDYSLKKRYAPPAIKLILLIAVILGFYFRSCWYDRLDLYFDINQVYLDNQTLSSVDVLFVIRNNTQMDRKESIFIKLYTDRGDELASRLTSVEIPARSQRRYRKMVENWERALYSDEELSHATVEIYKPKFF